MPYFFVFVLLLWLGIATGRRWMTGTQALFVRRLGLHRQSTELGARGWVRLWIKRRPGIPT